MKHLAALLLATTLCGCATTPTGQRVYAGPTFSVSLGFMGASIGATVMGATAAPAASTPILLAHTGGLAK